MCGISKDFDPFRESVQASEHLGESACGCWGGVSLGPPGFLTYTHRRAREEGGLEVVGTAGGESTRGPRGTLPRRTVAPLCPPGAPGLEPVAMSSRLTQSRPGPAA